MMTEVTHAICRAALEHIVVYLEPIEPDQRSLTSSPREPTRHPHSRTSTSPARRTSGYASTPWPPLRAAPVVSSNRLSCSGHATHRSATRPSASGPPRCGQPLARAYQPVAVLKMARRRPPPSPHVPHPSARRRPSRSAPSCLLARRRPSGRESRSQLTVLGRTDQCDGGHVDGRLVEIAELAPVIRIVAFQPRVADGRLGDTEPLPETAPSSSSRTTSRICSSPTRGTKSYRRSLYSPFSR